MLLIFVFDRLLHLGRHLFTSICVFELFEIIYLIEFFLLFLCFLIAEVLQLGWYFFTFKLVHIVPISFVLADIFKYFLHALRCVLLPWLHKLVCRNASCWNKSGCQLPFTQDITSLVHILDTMLSLLVSWSCKLFLFFPHLFYPVVWVIIFRYFLLHLGFFVFEMQFCWCNYK